MAYRISSETYHHDLKKKFSGVGIWGDKRYTILTDSLGFKNGSVKDIPLTSPNRRIVFIGDSFTEGIGVPYEETFVGLIAHRLLPRNIEVLNAAASSYSPIIYWRKIKYLIEEVGLQFDELFVFIDISDIPDEVNRYTLSEHHTVDSREDKGDTGRMGEEGTVGSIKNLIRENTILPYFLLDKTYDLLSPPKVQTPFQRWTIDKTLFPVYGEKGLEKATLYMDRLFELLKKHNVKLTIAVYPWPDQIVNNDLNSIQVTFWKKWAEEKKIPLLNYFPCFVASNRSETESKLLITDFFIKGDDHWNERGHQLIAEQFLSFYERGRACKKNA